MHFDYQDARRLPKKRFYWWKLQNPLLVVLLKPSIAAYKSVLSTLVLMVLLKRYLLRMILNSNRILISMFLCVDAASAYTRAVFHECRECSLSLSWWKWSVHWVVRALEHLGWWIPLRWIFPRRKTYWKLENNKPLFTLSMLPIVVFGWVKSFAETFDSTFDENFFVCGKTVCANNASFRSEGAYSVPRRSTSRHL